MKKLLVFLLTTLLMLSCIIPSFADTTAGEAEILEAAKKGTVLYCVSTTSTDNVYLMHQHKSDLTTQNDLGYVFLVSIIPDYSKSNTIEYVADEKDLNPDSPYYDIRDGVPYVKLGDSIKSTEDIRNLCSTYLYGFTAVIDDMETTERDDKGYLIKFPQFLNIDGEVYSRTWRPEFNQSSDLLLFEDFTVVSYDNKKALVSAPIGCAEAKDEDNPHADAYYTIELVNDNGQWKVCDGTLFSEYMDSGRNYYFSPNTGEDLSLVTHTVIIVATLSLMLVLIKKRKQAA